MKGQGIVLRVDARSAAGALIAAEYRVHSVPTILILKRGKLVYQQAGVPNRDELIEILERMSS